MKASPGLFATLAACLALAGHAARIVHDFDQITEDDLTFNSSVPDRVWDTLMYGFKVDGAESSYLRRTMMLFAGVQDMVRMSPASRVRGDIKVSDSETTAAEHVATAMGVEGSYAGFSAAVSMSASHSSETRVKTTRVDVEVIARKYTLTASAGFRFNPQTYLDPHVLAFIRESAPNELLELGEFYAYYADLGGLFRKTKVMEMRQGETSTGLVADASSGFKGFIGSLNARMSVEYGVREGTANANTKTWWQCEVGEPMVWLGANSGNIDQIQSTWAHSVTDANLYSYNFKLKPIWGPHWSS